jgi:hypothetical protein
MKKYYVFLAGDFEAEVIARNEYDALYKHISKLGINPVKQETYKDYINMSVCVLNESDYRVWKEGKVVFPNLILNYCDDK